MKTILIVDGDLGLVAFLSRALSDAGFAALPATNGQMAIPLLEELENPTVDLLMVNLALPDTAAIVSTLKERNPWLKIIAIEDPDLRAVTEIQADAILRKPYTVEPAGEDPWVAAVKEILRGQHGRP